MCITGHHSTYRGMCCKAQVHQSCDSLHVRNENGRTAADAAVHVMITTIRHRIGFVLAANEGPAIHLEMGQIGGGQYATELQQFGRFQLHGAPMVEMMLVERCIHAG